MIVKSTYDQMMLKVNRRYGQTTTEVRGGDEEEDSGADGEMNCKR